VFAQQIDPSRGPGLYARVPSIHQDFQRAVFIARRTAPDQRVEIAIGTSSWHNALLMNLRCWLLAALLPMAACSSSESGPTPDDPSAPDAPVPSPEAPKASNKEASNYLRDQQVEACRCDKCRCNHCRGEQGARCYCLDRTRHGKTICTCGATEDGCKCDHCTGQPGGGACPCKDK
jgi:hypothetical protein